MTDLAGQAAPVTVESRGPRRIVATGLHEPSASVVSAWHDKPRAEAPTLALSPDISGSGMAVDCQVISQSSRRSVAEDVLAAYGRSDVFVSTGTFLVCVTDRLTTDRVRQLLEGNVIGAWRMMRLLLWAVRRQVWLKREGRCRDRIGRCCRSVWPCRSQGGVGQLTRSLAMGWADTGITVNSVALGQSDTPLGRPVHRRMTTSSATKFQVRQSPRRCLGGSLPRRDTQPRHNRPSSA
jgi:NAD(P)-dependent dehydrogenase (short-subunit alcohol dehydrogenase family)